jgi:hypothetical protein
MASDSTGGWLLDVDSTHIVDAKTGLLLPYLFKLATKSTKKPIEHS